MQNCNNDFLNSIILNMDKVLNTDQLILLKNTLEVQLYKYEVILPSRDLVVYDANVNEKIIKIFIASKRLENCSMGTLKQYNRFVRIMLEYINKDYNKIKTNDIKFFLIKYQENRKISNGYLDTIRLYISSFFSFLSAENYIEHNPCLAIKRIKSEKKIYPVFDGETLEKLRCGCKDERTRAVIEILYSTGMRIGELFTTNIGDVDFNKREIKLSNTKGKKERIVYFTPSASLHLKKYLVTRNDYYSLNINDEKINSIPLITAKKGNCGRLSIGGLRRIVEELGVDLKISDVHPHKFRRTLATTALSKGMDLSEVQEILGHSEITTTRMYCNISQENTKNTYNRLII